MPASLPVIHVNNTLQLVPSIPTTPIVGVSTLIEKAGIDLTALASSTIFTTTGKTLILGCHVIVDGIAGYSGVPSAKLKTATGDLVGAFPLQLLTAIGNFFILPFAPAVPGAEVPISTGVQFEVTTASASATLTAIVSILIATRT